MRMIWKKTMTLLLALCLMAGLLPLGALADTAISVSTLEELQNALKTARQKITLTATITVDDNLELDLNGCTVTFRQDAFSVGLELNSGILTLKDSVGVGSFGGTAKGMGLTAVRIHGGTLVIDGGAINVNSAQNSTASVTGVLVASDYVSRGQENAVCVYSGKVAVSAADQPYAIRFSDSTSVGFTMTGGTVSAASMAGDTAYALYLNKNPFLITGGTVSAGATTDKELRWPYAIYRAASAKPLPAGEVRGSDTRIKGIVYMKDGIDPKTSGFTGGKYSAWLNNAYIHSGYTLKMHEDDKDKPYFWWIDGSGAGGDYTVTFNAGGGSGAMSAIKVGVGESRVLPACAFKKTNCSFRGWATSADGSVVYADKGTIKDLTEAGGTATLYAVWNQTAFDVTWYSYDGSYILARYAAEKGARPVYAGAEPTESGKVFRGWAETANQSAGRSVVELPAVTADVSYYAAFSEKTTDQCAVSWYDYAGNTLLRRDLVTKGDRPVYGVPEPTESGKVFRGWAGKAKQSSGIAEGALPSVSADVNYFAAFSEKAADQCTVTWYDYSGKVMLSRDLVNKGARPAYVGAEPTMEGGVFTGWATRAGQSEGQAVGLLPAVTADVSYYAAFRTGGTEQYEVVWRSYDGKTVLARQTVDRNSRPSYGGSTPTWSQTGFHDFAFEGWNTAPKQSHGAKDSELPLVTDDVIYYAAFSMTPNSYTVAFDPNGGAGTMAPQAFTYEHAQALTQNAFTFTGHDFAGWAETAAGPVRYADGASVKNLASEDGATVTLYAKWTPKRFTVSWHDVDGTLLDKDTAAEYGSKPVYRGPAPVIMGGVFEGWATTPHQSTGAQEKDLPVVTDNAAYYVAYSGWAPDYFTIRWMDYTGAHLLASDYCAVNAAPAYSGTPPTLEKTGYTCTHVGWAAAPKQSAGITLPRVTEDAVYYAAFTVAPNHYTVRYNAGSVQAAGSMADQPFTYNTAAALTPCGFTSESHHFLGWATTAGGAVRYRDGETVCNLTAEPGGVVELYGVWEINRYTVTWCNGEYVIESDTVTHSGRPEYHSPEPHNIGGAFRGWATAPEQTTGKTVAELPPVTADTVYYAAFEKVLPPAYTLKWMNYEGTETLLVQRVWAQTKVAFGQDPPSRSVTGYTCVFTGWAEAAKQSAGTQESDLPRVTADTTYYAAFTVTPNAYTVRFHAGSDQASGSMADQPFTYDAAAALTPCGFTSESCHFLGWATTEGGAVRYRDGETVCNLTAAQGGVVDLYGVWEINRYTVLWCYSDYVIERDTVVHGGRPEFTGPLPTITGGTFQGWALTPKQREGVPVSELPHVTADVVYYTAYKGWAPNYYTVTWMDEDGRNVLESKSHVYNALPEYEGAQPTRSIRGYSSDFKGWSHLPGQSVPGKIERVTEDAVYYAAFADTPHRYTVAFDPDGRAGSMAPMEAVYDLSASLPPLGFTPGPHDAFLGWAETRGGPVRFADGASIRNLTDVDGATVTLYAVWAERESLLVFFDANGGTAELREKLVYLGEPYGALPQATYAGKSFAGWFTAREGGTAVTADTLVSVAADHTLYARWNDPYDPGGGGGGGGGSTPTTSYNPDGSITVTSREVISNGDGTTTVISKETTTAPDGTVQEITLTETGGSRRNSDGSATKVEGVEDSTVVTRADGSVSAYVNARRREETAQSQTLATGETITRTVVETSEKTTQTEKDAAGRLNETVTEKTSREETERRAVPEAGGGKRISEQRVIETGEVETVLAAGARTERRQSERVEETLTLTEAPDGTLRGSGSYTGAGRSSGPDGEHTYTLAGEIEVYTDAKGSVFTVRDGTRSEDGGAPVRERRIDGVSALGTTAKVREREGRIVEAEVFLSDAEVENARRTGTPVIVPMLVTPGRSAADAEMIEVDLTVLKISRSDNHLNVSDMPLAEIGLTEEGNGIVVFYLTGEDTPAIVRECSEGSIIFPVNDYMRIVIAHNEKTFPDIASDAWYADCVGFAAAREIMIGTGENFEPETDMSRAMVAQIIYNYERDRHAEPDCFEDVEPTDWFADAVGWAGSVGYVKGDGERFRPNEAVTRQDLVTMLYRYALDEGYNVRARAELTRFRDSGDVADYALEAIQWAVADGILLGMDDGNLCPTETATRAQVAAIMARFVRNAKGSGVV